MLNKYEFITIMEGDLVAFATLKGCESNVMNVITQYWMYFVG